MTLQMATISGQLVRPDIGRGAMTVTIEAATDGSRLTFDGMVIAGKIPVRIQQDGTATVTIPKTGQSGLAPTGAKWMLVHRLNGQTVYSTAFDLPADTTWDTIYETENGPVTPSAIARAEAAAALAEAAVVTTQASDTGTIPAPGKRVLVVVNPGGGWIDDLIVEDI